MDIVTGIIKSLFGSKADKDRLEPYVNKIRRSTLHRRTFERQSAAGARR